jgi:hypothetical protein
VSVSIADGDDAVTAPEPVASGGDGAMATVAAVMSARRNADADGDGD